MHDNVEQMILRVNGSNNFVNFFMNRPFFLVALETAIEMTDIKIFFLATTANLKMFLKTRKKGGRSWFLLWTSLPVSLPGHNQRRDGDEDPTFSRRRVRWRSNLPSRSESSSVGRDSRPGQKIGNSDIGETGSLCGRRFALPSTSAALLLCPRYGASWASSPTWSYADKDFGLHLKGQLAWVKTT